MGAGRKDMTGSTMDINSDCGESFGNWKMGADEMVLPRVTTANVACGFHGGDPVTLVQTVEMALENGVEVGAHPGLPDLLGFGRRRMDISPDDAYAYIVYQVGALQAVLRARGGTLHHVKPHGSLAMMLMTERELADAVAAAIADTCDQPMIYLPGPLDGVAMAEAAAKYGVRAVAEVYPDLSYDDDGALVLQRQKAHTPIEDVADQITRFLEQGKVQTLSGKLIDLQAESICVHGDGPNAAEVIDAVRAAIERCGRTIAPLAPTAPARPVAAD
jgi:UPF0271 protein